MHRRAHTSAEAARLSQITYRQLDHWARRGWIQPSIDPGTGRSGRRLYSPEDVLRLAALRHFSHAGWRVESAGVQMAHISLADERFVVIGSKSGIVLCGTGNDLQSYLRTQQKFTVYDTERLWRRMKTQHAAGITDGQH